MSRKPNFLIIGVPKAGTSSLYMYLKKHPEVFLTSQKELHFFSAKKLSQNLNGPGDKEAFSRVIKNWESYIKLFKNVKNEKIIGDISPSYLYFSKSTIPLIKEKLGVNTKIIITLRDPIERLHSQFLHKTRLMLETKPIELALAYEEKRKKNAYGDFWQYKAHSLYFENCKNFIDSFGKDNVKIIIFENILSEPQKTVKEIFNFLEVDQNFIPENLDEVFNKGGYYKKNKLTTYLLKPNLVKQFLYKHLGRFIGRIYSNYKNKVLKTHTLQKPIIPDKTVQELKAYFKQDVELLKTKYGLDISKWKHFN